jgi:hypothetical protein
MEKRGRKSKFEELQIVERYAELSTPAFDFLKECLKGKNKGDKRWAVEQLSKGFAKMIPQQIGGINNEPIQVQWLSQSNINLENGQKPSTTA